ncbi:MAG: 50S ribosomal subunit stability factor [Candidatus Westeberhardia cardiocondylae]|nr:50S ribosomal subunit stability factor [Candidatus Westeberhardia cardiocondylae]
MISTHTIALVGRKNVGKSTIFNQLTNQKKNKINHSTPTQDRKYGYIIWKNTKYIIIDTGGFSNKKTNQEIEKKIYKQSLIAIQESNIILLVIDGSMELTKTDKNIAKLLLKIYNKQTITIINKMENVDFHHVKKNFLCLGTKEIIPISALYRRNISQIKKKIFSIIQNNNKIITQNTKNISIKNNSLKKNNKKYTLEHHTNENTLKITKISIIGRPNAGKSTLVNCILGKHRVITHYQPGTTRENIYIHTTFNKKQYILIDTVGVQKKNIINHANEKYITTTTLYAIKNADIILIIMDATIEIFHQDISLQNYINKKIQKTIIIVFNKCDLLNNKQKNILKKKFINYFTCIRFIAIHFVSAKYNIGITNLFQIIYNIEKIKNKKINTSTLIKIVQKAISKKPLPLINKKKIHIKCVYIEKYNPLTIIIQGNNYINSLHNSYKQYLTKFFYKTLKIVSIPIKIKFQHNTKIKM